MGAGFLGEELVVQPEGMAEVEAYYRENYSESALREGLTQWYTRFESINSKFIKLVTDWQETEGDAKSRTAS